MGIDRVERTITGEDHPAYCLDVEVRVVAIVVRQLVVGPAELELLVLALDFVVAALLLVRVTSSRETGNTASSSTHRLYVSRNGHFTTIVQGPYNSVRWKNQRTLSRR